MSEILCKYKFLKNRKHARPYILNVLGRNYVTLSNHIIFNNSIQVNLNVNDFQGGKVF